MCGEPWLLGAESLSPRGAPGSPQECPFCPGASARLWERHPTRAGTCTAPDQVCPHQFDRPPFLPEALPSSSLPMDTSQPDPFVQCPDGGESCSPSVAWVGLVALMWPIPSSRAAARDAGVQVGCGHCGCSRRACSALSCRPRCPGCPRCCVLLSADHLPSVPEASVPVGQTRFLLLCFHSLISFRYSVYFMRLEKMGFIHASQDR